MQAAHAQFNVNLVVAEPNCFGLPTGSIAANVSGGAGPFSFIWSTGATGATLSNIFAGGYSVTVTDSGGASVVQSATVGQPAVVAVNLSANTCQAPFMIAATGTGGNPPYNYAWSTGATGSAITVPLAGTYCVTMTDQNLCGAVNCITVNFNPLDVSVAANGLTCPDSDDGEVEATATGGTPPFAYSWSNGATTAAQTGLPAGTYTVTVTDAAGCSDSASGTVSAPPPLTSNVVGAGPGCAGENNGSAMASANGGTPPYGFAWSTGATTAGIAGLAAGTYTVTITDANGCDIVDMISLTPVSNLQAMASATPESCPGANDGTATATAVNGVPPYVYLWSNGETTQSITGLSPAAYTVTIIDGAGCTAMATAEVTAAPPLEISLSSTDVTACDVADGTATVDILQGLAPLAISWSNGESTAMIAGLAGGTYGVTVTDANGCQATGSATIAESPPLQASVDGTETVCGPGNTGEANATAIGGTPPYSYEWSNGENTESIDGLTEGTYTLTITDANGCTAIADFTVDVVDDFTVNVVGRDVLCNGGNTGSILLVPGGGTAPYVYNWNTGATANEITGLSAGTYSVTVTEAGGCTVEKNITINEPPALSITATTGIGATCDNANDGAATVFANGGTPPYSYSWSNGANTSSISNLPAGAYSVTVTDANGCTAQASVSISAFDSPSCSIVITREITSAGNDGAAQANVSGGTAPFSYLWSNGQSSATAVNLAPGSYSVVVTDANGCETSCDITLSLSTMCENITDPGAIGYDQFLCGPGNDPDEIVDVVTPSGGTGAIEYLWMKSTVEGPFNMQTWMPISGADGPSYDPPALYETTYFVRCVRRENCTLYQESNIVTIEVGDVANAQITAPDFLCVGEPITILAGPTGTGAILSWEVYGDATPATGAGPSFTITALSSGIVTVVLYVSENGCDASNFVNLTATASPLYCSGQNRTMPINVNVVNEEEGEVMVSWMMEEALAPGLEFTVEYSEDGVHFEALGEMNTPLAYLGSMNYYEFAHLSTKRGRNFYRIQIQSQYGETFFSEIGEAILYNDSEVALLYPNPTANRVVLELFENFGQKVQVEIFSANGARMFSKTFLEDTQRAEFDLSGYPAGVYFFNLRYSKAGVKVLKVLKH